MSRPASPLRIPRAAACLAAALSACAADTGEAPGPGGEAAVTTVWEPAERPGEPSAGEAAKVKRPRKEPPAFVIELAELSAGTFSVRVPTGEYASPPVGAANYTVPGPVAAFRGPDGVWRGRGYLETYPRLLRFSGKVKGNTARLIYGFEEGKGYEVTLQAVDGAVLIDEDARLGPRNLYVLDCYHDWRPEAGFALDRTGGNHAFLYLPCFYDRPEVTIDPMAVKVATEGGDTLQAHTARVTSPPPPPGDGSPSIDARKVSPPSPAALAVVSADASKTDVAGFWVRDVTSWRKGDTMGIQLWQRRQLPGDPGSRHFLGPETKSDSTPNPRTRALLGESLYEGHVTIELSLGTGTRRLGFAVASKGEVGEAKDAVPEAFKAVVQANR